MPPPVRPKPSKAGLIIVSILAFLLLVGGAGTTYLWRSTASELEDTKADLNAQIEDLNQTVEEQQDTIDQLHQDLDIAGSELSDLEQERDGIENARRELEEDLDTVANCLDLLFAFLAESDLEKAEDMIPDVNRACEAADRVVAKNR